MSSTILGFKDLPLNKDGSSISRSHIAVDFRWLTESRMYPINAAGSFRPINVEVCAVSHWPILARGTSEPRLAGAGECIVGRGFAGASMHARFAGAHCVVASVEGIGTRGCSGFDEGHYCGIITASFVHCEYYNYLQ